VALEERGLAPSTIDRRLSTVCGSTALPHRRPGHLESRQYVPAAEGLPDRGHGMDRGELGTFLFTAERFDHAHTALAVSSGSTGCESARRAAPMWRPCSRAGSPDLRILGKGNKPAVIPLVPRTARPSTERIEERHEGPIVLRRDGQRLDRRTAHRWIKSIGKRAGLGFVHPHMLRSAFIMAALDRRPAPRRPDRGPPRRPKDHTIYDRRGELRPSRAYVVVAFVAGG